MQQLAKIWDSFGDDEEERVRERAGEWMSVCELVNICICMCMSGWVNIRVCDGVNECVWASE